MSSSARLACASLRLGRLGLICSYSLSAAEPVELDVFTDIAAAAGVEWRHFNGESEDRLLIETTCGGVGFLDFDNDGYLDIFFVNGGETPKGRSAHPVRHGLYRNFGGTRFEDVTDESGLPDLDLFGMGVAVADFDNDGFSDLYITGHPRNVLLRNNGNARFSDVTDQAGVGNLGEWSASAAWFDYNRDGYLDLFVTNYATLSTHDPPRCEYSGEAVYCAQTAYQGRPPTLYRGNGDGTFADVSERAGLRQLAGRALGVVTVDVDEDGWDDVFVARDASPNLLLINQRNETFQDRALEAEVAYSPDGIARAGMGVDAGDLNGDGAPDFVVTNFDSEFHALYVNSGSFPFQEVTRRSGLALHSRPYVGWGTSFLDYDNDGDLDLITANGHLNHLIERTRHDVKFEQPLTLLENDAKGAFHNRSDRGGAAFQTRSLHRGLAVGDVDNDGDPDVAVIRLGERPLILRNNVGDMRPWLGLDLEGTSSNRDAIGAKVRLLGVREGETHVRWVKGGSSFLSSRDKRILIGLEGKGISDTISVEIEWPAGTKDTISGLVPGRYHHVIESRRSN